MAAFDDNDTITAPGAVSATRRNVLLGATTLVAATAVASAVGGGVANAAQAEQLMCNLEGVGEFPIASFQWGIGRGISSPTGGSRDREASAPSISEITITKLMDSTSPLLMNAALFGEPTEATITAVGKNGTPVVLYVLGDTMVSGYSVSA